jgi:hypothetical protein
VGQIITREWIEERRAHNYRRTPHRRVKTPEEALDFVDEVGFCHFWPNKGAELPNLFHAIAGRVRPVPKQHDDPDMQDCWRWKDEALAKSQWYYGKLLRKRATLVSLDLLPTFYACSDNLGGLDDYLDEYHAGLMTAEAKWIYEALLEHGPLDTIQLRQNAGLGSGKAKSRFDRGLVELQAGLKVIPVGVARVGHWRYAFTYDLLQRQYPELPELARGIKRSEARRRLVSRYVDSVVAADRATVKRIFHVLKWGSDELKRTIEALLDEEAVVETEVGDLEQLQLLSSRALEQSV